MTDSKPDISDVAWTDWVLGHLTEDEMFNGHPTVDGLRRILPLVLGDLIENTTQVVQSPSPENNNRATVVCTITIEQEEMHHITVCGAADVFPGNTMEEFARFPVATAETRAEGRALRKALRLRKIIVAEEAAEHMPPVYDDNNITSAQINTIDKLCHKNRLDINVKKFINSGTQQYDDIQ